MVCQPGTLSAKSEALIPLMIKTCHAFIKFNLTEQFSFKFSGCLSVMGNNEIFSMALFSSGCSPVSRDLHLSVNAN